MSTHSPLVSVVIGVYNAGPELLPTLRSILEQQDVEFEVIVVDDGSTDSTWESLEFLATTDARVRAIQQPENQGLTKALIRGCEEVKGKYIARQDIGDLSLPGRLKTQVDFLEQNPEVVLCSCWTRTVGPNDEFLGTNCPSDSSAVASRKLLDGFTGVTHHGATMFRTSTYRQASGYRSDFYFAQDLDLWYRLLRFGEQAYVPQVQYQIQVTPVCLSSRYREQQLALAVIIRKLAAGIKTEINTQELLWEAKQIRPNQSAFSRNLTNAAAGNYWIARMLTQQADSRAFFYLVSAIRQQPLFAKAWLGFLSLGKAMLKRRASSFFKRTV